MITKGGFDRISIFILVLLLISTGVFAATNGQKQIIVTLGSNVAVIDGKPIALDAPPVSIKGKTMVPLRFIGETFGAKIDWDNATKSATLTITTSETQPCPECPKPPLHNLANISLFGIESSTNSRSDLFRIETGTISLSGSYYADYKTETLYRASIVFSLFKEDGTLVKNFEAIGSSERTKFNECHAVDKYCLPMISNHTTISNLQTGNYYYEINASVDSPKKDQWSTSLTEIK